MKWTEEEGVVATVLTEEDWALSTTPVDEAFVVVDKVASSSNEASEVAVQAVEVAAARVAECSLDDDLMADAASDVVTCSPCDRYAAPAAVAELPTAEEFVEAPDLVVIVGTLAELERVR